MLCYNEHYNDILTVRLLESTSERAATIHGRHGSVAFNGCRSTA